MIFELEEVHNSGQGGKVTRERNQIHDLPKEVDIMFAVGD